VKHATKQYYSEQDAASSLGITVPALHRLLDRYIFNDGTQRPANMELMLSDLLVLQYFLQQRVIPLQQKVVPIASR